MDKKLMLALILTFAVLGCVNSVSTYSDERGWHVNFTNSNNVVETMIPVDRGMNVSMVSNLSSGEVKVVLIINAKPVFSTVMSSHETVNYTLPVKGVCLVKLYARKASGSFDFLI